MSTKIYNGIKFKQASFDEVIGAVFAWRDEKMPDLTRQYASRQVASRCVRALDSGEERPYGTAMVWLLEQERTAQKGHHALCDTEFNVCVFQHPTGMYGTVYTPHREWATQFEEFVGATEFMYWNNSDPLDKCTEEEWNVRGKIWEDILGRLGIPAKRGISIDCSHLFRPEVGDVLKEFPSFDQRVKDTAYSKALGQGLVLHKDDSKNGLSAFYKAVDWVKTPDGKASKQKHKEAALKGLIKSPTVDDLLKGTVISEPHA